MPGHEDRVVWTIEQAKEAVKAFLAILESDGFGVVFADPNVDPSDLTAFRNDDSRRQDGQSAAARVWWASVRDVATHNSARFLTLAEPLAQHGIALDELYAAIPKEYHADALTQAFVDCGGRPQGGLPPGITATKGWTDEQIRERLEEVKGRLDWENTTGSANKWWVAFENENAHRWALVLRLAEELAVRKATITEFFLAYAYSNTDNIQANLCYLDYTRLKKEEERRKKDAAEKAMQEHLKKQQAAAAKKLESLLPDLHAGCPLPELSQDDVSILMHTHLDGIDPEVCAQLKEAISLAKARLATEAEHRREQEVARESSPELTVTRCPSCRSLVPAAAFRCRMCGNKLREGEGEG